MKVVTITTENGKSIKVSQEMLISAFMDLKTSYTSHLDYWNKMYDKLSGYAEDAGDEFDIVKDRVTNYKSWISDINNVLDIL